MDEKNAYIEGIITESTLWIENTQKIIDIIKESAKEVIVSQVDKSLALDDFLKKFSGNIERVIKVNKCCTRAESSMRLMASIVKFAFAQGFGMFLDGIVAKLDENILAEMKKIWGEKNSPGKNWDVSKFGEN